MDQAFCISLGVPLGAATATEKLRVGLIADSHDFLCRDRRCRERGVRVQLVAHDPTGDLLPHFRTCTRARQCLEAMGYNMGSEPKPDEPRADDLHVVGCESFERKTSSPTAGLGERTVNDNPSVLKTGTPIRVRSEASVAARSPAGLAEPGRVRNQKANSKLFGLADAVQYWPVADFGDRRIELLGQSRCVEELFIDALNLDALAFDNAGRPSWSARDGARIDFEQTPHVFFGPANIVATRGAAVRIGFDAGIDPALAFEPTTAASATLGLSLFVDDALLEISRNQVAFRESLDDIGPYRTKRQRCFVFVLGKLKRLVRTANATYLNVVPCATAEDIVVLPNGSMARYADLRRYLARRRSAWNEARVVGIREAAATAAEEIRVRHEYPEKAKARERQAASVERPTRPFRTEPELGRMAPTNERESAKKSSAMNFWTRLRGFFSL